jgi:hypothetical protein
MSCQRFDGTVACFRTNENREQQCEECAMTNAGQAFLLAAGLFGLSFLAIFAFWSAEQSAEASA